MAADLVWVSADAWDEPGSYSLHPGWLRPVARRTDTGEVGVLTDAPRSFALAAHLDDDGVVRQVYPSSALSLAEPGPAELWRVLAALGRFADRRGLAVDMRLAPQLAPALGRALGTPETDGEGWAVDVWEDCFFFDSRDSDADLLRGMSRTARQNLRTALRGGLRTCHAPAAVALDAFRDLYSMAMERLAAKPFLVFPRRFFDEVLAGYGDEPRVVLVHDAAGVPTAATLLLPVDDGYDSWLAGSDARAWSFRPNNLLFFAAAGFVREAGKARLYIGGGPRGLDRFKRGLSRNALPSYRLRRNLSAAQRARSDERLIPSCREASDEGAARGSGEAR